MPVTLKHLPDEKYLEVLLTGKITEQDYELFVPELERLIGEHGQLRMLVELRNFEGWTFSGLWEDLKFDIKHFNDIERLAIVGEKRWHEGMALFCKPFTTASIRYFESFEIGDAREWLTQERPGQEQPEEAGTHSEKQ